MPPRLEPVAILCRRGDDFALQGLRTAVSLSLGDREVTVLVTREAASALEAKTGSELAANLEAIRLAGIEILVEGTRDPDGALVSRETILRAFARRPLRQVF